MATPERIRCPLNMQVIITHPDRKRILLFPEESGGRKLPDVVVASDKTGDIANCVQEDLEFEGRLEMCRIIWQEVEVNDAGGSWHGVCVLRSDCSPGAPKAPSNLEWVEVEKSSILHPRKEAQSEIDAELRYFMPDSKMINRYTRSEDQTFIETVAWMTKELEAQDCGRVLRAAQVSAGSLNLVVKAETGTGSYFLKRSSSPNEAVLTQALSTAAPNFIWKPLVIDAEKNFLMSPEFDSSMVIDSTKLSVEERQKVLKNFARLQITAAACMDTIRRPEVRVFSLPWMKSHIDFLLGHEECVAAELTSLTAEGNEKVLPKLTKMSSKLKNACEKVDQLSLPLAPVHNDFFQSNLLSPRDGKEEYTFFDWAAGCITHPFFEVFLHVGMPKEDWEVYLQEWKAYASADKLRDCLSWKEFYIALRLCQCFVYLFDSVEAVPPARAATRGRLFLNLQRLEQSMTG